MTMDTIEKKIDAITGDIAKYHATVAGYHKIVVGLLQCDLDARLDARG